ncbi:zinc ribbon domain-containing protein [Anaerotalea alkaliphila]|uniref:Zinc ribbon domain-containing protein n=1 Tax=Anaerotalea alkaliphila TaxID=2662126 RepID=A0A7X5HU95_9FIRM|nr:zinc ribbon domain-containing protein [Anaerotalea alkaliphila]NDL66785.1 zinc ribbon domain-containing protein [Anaerotalea alkaliphila]
MNKACNSCSAQLSANVKFCRKCGKPVAEERKCIHCGRAVSETAKFCRGCGKPAAGMIGRTSRAPGGNGFPDRATAREGELIFEIDMPDTPVPDTTEAAVMEAHGPIRILAGGLATAIKGIGMAGKNKKALSFALGSASVWLVLSLLAAVGVPVPSWLRFLTFADGGTTGGAPGMLGGIVGKGMFVSLVAGLATGARSRARVKKEKDRAGQSAAANGLGLTLAGMGLAWMLYNWMSGDNSPQNSIIGIVAAGTALRSSSQSGFIRRLLFSVTGWLSRTKLPTDLQAGRLTAGVAAGFALGVPMSVVEIPWIGYFAGLLILLTGAALSLKSVDNAHLGSDPK